LSVSRLHPSPSPAGTLAARFREITLKAAEQTNRNLQVLSTVTTIFLPASLVAGIFGMNVAGLPLLHDKSGFLWAMVILVAASVLVYWSLKRWGVLRR
jgi:zinc transporter